MMNESRQYRDRVSHALDFIPTQTADTDSILLDCLKRLNRLDPDKYQNEKLRNKLKGALESDTKVNRLLTRYLKPDNNKELSPGQKNTLLKGVYSIWYTARLTEEEYNEELKDLFESRGRGNNTPTPLDHYRKFFSPYTTTDMNRDKLLQMCIVFQIPEGETNDLLEKFGYTRLYAASLFECCIWYILTKQGTLVNLYQLYEKALKRSETCLASPEYTVSSRSQLCTQIFLDLRTSFEKESDFIDNFVAKVGYYFRFYSRAATEIFLDLNTHTSDFYDYFAPIIPDTRTSFYQQCLDIQENSHVKNPSRECLILMKLYDQMFRHAQKARSRGLERAQNTLASPATLNEIFERCGFAQWNTRESSFDRLINELLSYSEEDAVLQIDRTAKLLSLYQFAQYAKNLPKKRELTNSNRKIAVTAFDSILQQEASSFDFVESCLKIGRAFQYLDTDTSSPRRFLPSREYLLFLFILQAITQKNDLPDVEAVNDFLTIFQFAPLKKNFYFDAFIHELLSNITMKTETKLDLLCPFYCFIFSFKQISNSKTYENSKQDDPFATVFLFANNEKIVSNTVWRASLVQIFDVIENIYGEWNPDKKKNELNLNKEKLLKHKTTIQSMFSYLELNLVLPQDRKLENLSISVLGQEKYPSREPKITKKDGKETAVATYHNLHYGSYEIAYNWTENGTALKMSFPVTLSANATSKIIKIVPNQGQWVVSGQNEIVPEESATRLEIRVTRPEWEVISDLSIFITNPSDVSEMEHALLPAFQEEKTWTTVFHRLDQGSFEIHFKWNHKKNLKEISFPVNLGSESQTFILEVNDGHNVQIFEHKSENGRRRRYLMHTLKPKEQKQNNR